MWFSTKPPLGSLCQILGDRVAWDEVILGCWCLSIPWQLLLVSSREHEARWGSDKGGLAEP